MEGEREASHGEERQEKALQGVLSTVICMPARSVINQSPVVGLPS